jgi:hypothetical protein
MEVTPGGTVNVAEPEVYSTSAVCPQPTFATPSAKSSVINASLLLKKDTIEIKEEGKYFFCMVIII